MLFKKRLYMDYASSTPVHDAVVREMVQAVRQYGNPSAPHEEGRAARTVLEDARRRIARVLLTRPETLTITGSGTESNNLAIVGFIEALIARGATYSELHIVVSAIEHPSIHEPVAVLQKRGVAVSYVLPDAEGIIQPAALLKDVRPETVLVSVAAVQSEIGQVEPLKDIARILKPIQKSALQNNQRYTPECPLPVLHTDASQGPLYLDVAPERLGASLVTYDAQKIMGPKGVGLLYKHSSVPLKPILHGGSQERMLRPGTENIVAAAGMACAFEHAAAGMKERALRVSAVRDFFIERVTKEIPGAVLNGGTKHRIANNVHISIPGADGDYLAVLMDSEGVAVSPRSSCIASGTPSKTVEALGKSSLLARGTLRFSFGPSVTRHDAVYAVAALQRCLKVVSRA